MTDLDKYADMLREWREECRRMPRDTGAKPFRGRWGRREPLPPGIKVWSETGEYTTFPEFGNEKK